MDNIVGRQFFISKFQKELIIGSLLGDGRLECRSKQGSARLRIHQGWKQKDFVFWKYKKLQNLVLRPPRKIVCWKNPKNNENYHSWYFHTRTTLELGKFHKMFYKNGKKILPKNIFNLLTPICLAVWIMDDGCYSEKSIILNTQNFSLTENIRLQNTLQRKFNLKFGINKDRNKQRLRLSRDSFQKLQNIVKPYIIPSMKYKIVPVTTSQTKTKLRDGRLLNCHNTPVKRSMF